jgi:hypothetical protein
MTIFVVYVGRKSSPVSIRIYTEKNDTLAKQTGRHIELK